MSGINVFNSAVRQLQGSQRNLQAISAARQKLDQEKERLEFEKKKGEVLLEGMRLDNTAKKSDMEFAKKTMDSRMKLMQMALEQQGSMIDHEEEKQQGIAEESLNTAKTIARQDPFVLAPYMTGSGDVGVRPVKTRYAGGQSFTEKDVLAEARAMAKESTDPADMDLTYVQRMQKYIPEARKMLSGSGNNTQQEQSVKRQNATSEKVKVRLKDGRTGSIPKSRLQEYIAGGAKEIR